MKKKKSETTREQKQAEVRSSELSDFYGLLDKLLPQGKELFSEVLEKKQKHLADIRDKEKDDLQYALEIEKAKNNCWREYANILFAQYHRLSADYDNLQKRTSKQITESVSYEKERIIKAILPALDNFEHTLQNASSVETVDVFLKGTQIIYDQMLDILKSLNVEQIKALGEIFDPVMHQAVMQKTELEQEENIVLEEFQKGYTLNGKVIRPSKVIVNKPAQEQPAEQTVDEDETADEE